MNPRLALLQPYPFQRLRELMEEVAPHPSFLPINLSIGEPKHTAPAFIQDTLMKQLSGLSTYPVTAGSDSLRNSIAQWVGRRYHIPALDAETQVLPVNGSREALFAIAQAVIAPPEAGAPQPIVISPNPFYQIYEGAALLAGAEPYYVNTGAAQGFRADWASVPEAVWERTQLVYVCSPGNPTGAVMKLEEWEMLFSLSDRYGFVIASDECYSEIWFNEAPLGGLEAAVRLGRPDFRRLIMFSSLSKRSNVPGLRSGFVAGDAAILKKFLLYRTYQGCAMSPVVQAASQVAWKDEAHVVENRRLYAEKFKKVVPILSRVLPVEMPEAGFYLWVNTPVEDTRFAQELYRQCSVTVLPGSFLARTAHGINPGASFIRIALVAGINECVEAALRISDFVKKGSF